MQTNRRKYSFIIDGHLPTKANSRRIVPNKKTGKIMSIKSEDALNWTQACIYICNIFMAGKTPLKGPVALRAHIYYRSNRSDLDVSLLMDGLQKGRIYSNDRQVVYCESFKHIDPIVAIWELEEPQKTPIKRKNSDVKKKRVDSNPICPDNLPIRGEKGEIL